MPEESESHDPDEWVEYLSGASVAEVIMAGRRLCSRKGVPYDEFKIGVGTDYGTRVVVYLIDD